MKKCKTCNNIIPDGTEYCDDCLKNNNEKLSESYLDSLLNSVAIPNKQKRNATSEERDFNHKSRLSNNNLTNISSDNETNVTKEKQNVTDVNNLDNDFKDENQDNSKEMDDIFSFIQNLSDNDNNDESSTKDGLITNNELVANNDLMTNDELAANNEHATSDELLVNDEFAVNNEFANDNELVNNNELSDNNESDIYNILESMGIGNDDSLMKNNNSDVLENYVSDDYSDGNTDDNTDDNQNDNQDDIINLIGNDSNSDILNFVNNTEDFDSDNLSIEENDDNPDDDLMALLNMITGLENADSQQYEDINEDINYDKKQTNQSVNKSKSQNKLFLVEDDEIHMMDDLDFDGTKSAPKNYEVKDLDTLSDIKTVDDFNSLKANSQNDDIHEDENNSDLNKTDENNKAKDFSGVFSDSISAVDTLGDLHNTINLFEDKPKKKNFFQKLFSKSKNKDDKKSNKEKSKGNSKKNSKKNSKSSGDEDLVTGSKDKGKLLNNERARDLTPNNSRDREKSKVKDKENSKDKVKKKNFSLLGFKKKNNNNEEATAEDDNSKNINKKASKKSDKLSEKKANKLAKKKSQNVIDELEAEADEGKINKFGAVFIFALIGVLAIVIIYGTNVFTYSLSIDTATTDFNRQRYTDAYNEIYGLQVHKSNKEIYNKIMTVMYVNKQLDSYYNYKEIGKYPEALDSLIKGLERYETYKAEASKLGIEGDLDSIRKQIIKELKNEFDTTEKDAMKLVSTSNQTVYSNQIFDIVSKVTN